METVRQLLNRERWSPQNSAIPSSTKTSITVLRLRALRSMRPVRLSSITNGLLAMISSRLIPSWATQILLQCPESLRPRTRFQGRTRPSRSSTLHSLARCTQFPTMKSQQHSLVAPTKRFTCLAPTRSQTKGSRNTLPTCMPHSTTQTTTKVSISITETRAGGTSLTLSTTLRVRY